MEKIITHGGSAHRDDFLSCAIALAHYPEITRIERRTPTDEELANPDILILDVGNDYNPELHNFDHHQFDRDHAPECALSLFTRHIGLDLSASRWYESTVIADAMGPNAVATHFGLDKYPFELNSPIETILLSWYEKEKVVSNDMTAILRKIGEDIVTHTRELENAVGIFTLDCVEEINGKKAVVITDRDSLEVPAFSKARAIFVASYNKNKNPDDHIKISITPNRDRDTQQFNGGWVIYRLDDNSGVDLSGLAQNDLIDFSHKSGFLAITKPCDLDQLKSMI